MTPTELEISHDAEELAELAGLDRNTDPRRFNDFCARAEVLLVKWFDRSRMETR